MSTQTLEAPAPPAPKPRDIYLPGLDGLRAVAALSVVVHHAEQARYLFGLPNSWDVPFIYFMGGSAVSFFFVLSGFLITYLLLTERQDFGVIDFRAFYLRRVFRIFPLYYFVVFLGFFILPWMRAFDLPNVDETFSPYYVVNLAMYLALSPQFAYVFFPIVAYSGVLWSVGTEEWFYAVWPWAVALFKRNLPYFCILVIAVMTLCRYIWFLDHPRVNIFLTYSRFDNMAVGALGAFFVRDFRNSGAYAAAFRLLFRPDVQLAVYIALVLSLFSGHYYGIYEQPLFAALYLAIILNVALNPRTILTMEGRVLKYLGKISYGLYCYNWIGIMTVVVITRTLLGFASQHDKGTIILVFGVAVTIGMSALSYRYLERPFLILKKRFEKKGSMDVAGAEA